MTALAMEEVDRYASPSALASVSGAPELVCRMVFAIGQSREGIQILRSSQRPDHLCRQRHAIAWAAREFAGATFDQIGRALNRDGNGSVVVRSYNRAKLLRRRDPEFRRLCDDLKSVLMPREIRRVKARTR